MLPTNLGGGSGKVAVIDTEGGFRPEKIGPIAERFGVKAEVSYCLPLCAPTNNVLALFEPFDCFFSLLLPAPQDVLENLIVCRCFNSDHQISTIQKLAAFMIEDGPFAMVIIDSGEHASASPEAAGDSNLGSLSTLTRLVMRCSSEECSHSAANFSADVRTRSDLLILTYLHSFGSDFSLSSGLRGARRAVSEAAKPRADAFEAHEARRGIQRGRPLHKSSHVQPRRRHELCLGPQEARWRACACSCLNHSPRAEKGLLLPPLSALLLLVHLLLQLLLPVSSSCSGLCSWAYCIHCFFLLPRLLLPPLQEEETPLHAFRNRLTPQDCVPYRSAGTWRPENLQGDAHVTCFRMLGLCSACIPDCCDLRRERGIRILSVAIAF